MLLRQQLRFLFLSVFFIETCAWAPTLSCLRSQLGCLNGHGVPTRTMLSRPGVATRKTIASKWVAGSASEFALKCSESDTEIQDGDFQALSDNAADVMSLPMHPDPNMKPEDVILALVRGLQVNSAGWLRAWYVVHGTDTQGVWCYQFNDVPEPDSGLRRCFEFSCDMCKAAVGGVESRAGGASVETFIKYAKNPTFQSMLDCTSFKRGPINVIAGTETRGALATQVVTILRDGSKDRKFLWTLQQERRPPLEGCWLVRECLFMENAIELTL